MWYSLELDDPSRDVLLWQDTDRLDLMQEKHLYRLSTSTVKAVKVLGTMAFPGHFVSERIRFNIPILTVVSQSNEQPSFAR